MRYIETIKYLIGDLDSGEALKDMISLCEKHMGSNFCPTLLYFLLELLWECTMNSLVIFLMVYHW